MVVGIDPGLHGAVAMVGSEGTYLMVTDTPTLLARKSRSKRLRKMGHLLPDYNIPEMCELIGRYVAPGELVVIEHVASRPKQGVSSTFLFGLGLGLWQGISVAHGHPLLMVRPQVWKEPFGLLDAEKTEVIDEAKKRWPSAPLTLAKHDGRAEALFLAEYGRLYAKR